MRKRTSPDRIASTIRDIRADLGAGLNVNQACRKAGINPTTYYRWKTLQEDPVSNEQLRLGELEAEFAATCARYVPIEENPNEPLPTEQPHH
jgi:transposase-like protein